MRGESIREVFRGEETLRFGVSGEVMGKDKSFTSCHRRSFRVSMV